MKPSIKYLSLMAVACGVLASLPVCAQENGDQSDIVLFGPASNPSGFVGFIQFFETNASQFYPAILPATVPSGAVLFYEDASQTLLSDQLWVQNDFWYFASDPDLQNLSGVPFLGSLVEDGTAQDVSSFFH